MSRYHCYTGWCEAVYDSDVEADSPQQAAEMAAGEHGIIGVWTVVEGVPVNIKVGRQSIYKAES